jgi:hypothetical protein
MKTLKKLVLASAVSVALCWCAGCGSTPYATDQTVASFDGNAANAGIVQYLPDGSLEITPLALDRFNCYVEKYGDRLLPPAKKNFGCTGLSSGNYKMTKQAAEIWHEMIELRKKDEINGGGSK